MLKICSKTLFLWSCSGIGLPISNYIRNEGDRFAENSITFENWVLNRRKSIALMLCKNTDLLKCCNAEIQKYRILPILRNAKLDSCRARWQKFSSLSARAKMAIQISSGAYLLLSPQMRRFCAWLQISKFNSVQYAIYHVVVQFCPRNFCAFDPPKTTFFAQSISKSATSATRMQS